MTHIYLTGVKRREWENRERHSETKREIFFSQVKRRKKEEEERNELFLREIPCLSF